MRALRFGIGVAIALAEAALAVTIIASSDHSGQPWLTATISITAGLTFVAAGLVALWRRPGNNTGAWLAATGYLWFIAALGGADSSGLWTIGFVLGNLAIVSFAALVLAYPLGTLCRRDRAIVALGALVAIGGNLVVALFDSSPATQCDDCPASAIAIGDSKDVAAVASIGGSTIAAALLVTIVVILARRWRHASATSRRALGPVYGSSTIAVLLLVFSIATEQIASRQYSAAWYLFLLWFAIVPMTFLAGVLRTRLDQASAAKMLLSLDAGIPLRDVLADALHDPSLEIVYWIETLNRWVDELGREAASPVASESRSVTMVERGGRRIAALVHDPALDSEPDLVGLIAAGASLPIENARLQADLRSQFLFLVTVANTAPSLLVVLGTDGRIRNQNRATVEASGLPDEDAVRGRFFWDVFIDAAEREAMQARFRDAAPDFPPSHYENAFTNAQGEPREIEWGSAPVTDATGRVTSIVVGGIDITERKQREVQLQRERDITETLMQAIPSLVVVVDSEGLIVDAGYDEARAGVNNAFRKTLGWDDSQTVRRSVLDFIDPADAYVASMMIAGAANGMAMSQKESRWLSKEGPIDVAWTATPIDDVTGRSASLVLLSGVDITERNQQEAEIRASRSRIIEAAGEERRKLERNLHDGAQQRLVSLSVSLRLAESLLDHDPAGARQVVVGSRAELAAALEELRELARGIHPAVLTDQGLAAAVEALAARTPLPIEIDLPFDRLPAPIEAAVYYVISESLANVVKYASAKSVDVRVEAGADWVTVTVFDDGVGGADPARGTGLNGLSDRVAALDGTLRVDSRPGEGTRISAEMPVGVVHAAVVDSPQ